ncbi:MAG: sigma factor [Bacillota bacterium]
MKNFSVARTAGQVIPWELWGSNDEHFRRYYPAVCRHLTCILGDSGLAEDVAQETFIKLYQSPPDVPGKTGVWLFRVATNLAYNLIRSEKSRFLRESRVQEEVCTAVASEEIVIRKEEAGTAWKGYCPPTATGSTPNWPGRS